MAKRVKAAKPVAVKRARNPLVVSYQQLQQFLGYLGAGLPIMLLLFGWLSGFGLEPSISDFYYTPMGDVLVGVLCAIGVFLLFYRGYNPLPHEWLSDRQVSFVAGIAAFGVAVFPVHREHYIPCNLAKPDCFSFGLTIHPNWFHYGSAAIFFACLAVFCLVLFTRGDRAEGGAMLWTPRNRFYVGCGLVIVASMIAMAPVALLSDAKREELAQAHYLFWLESLGVFAFAASWLRKGRAHETVMRGVRAVVRRLG
jgi:hypothetical protein